VIDLARQCGAGRITLAVATFNARAIRVYERCGFVETGRHVRRLGGRDWEFANMELKTVMANACPAPPRRGSAGIA